MSSVNPSPEIGGLFPIPVARYNYLDELNSTEVECINKELDIDIDGLNNFGDKDSDIGMSGLQTITFLKNQNSKTSKNSALMRCIILLTLF